MKDVSEMKVLITGGNGYIGKTLTEKLNKYYDVYSVSRDDFDLTDSHSVNAWFEGKTFDAVLHTAVSGGSRLKKDSFDTVNHNLMMYYNLYGNRDKFSKLINFSSGAEMCAPDKPYGKSKKIISESVKNTDTHTVPIHIENKFMGEPYCAEDNIPPGDLIGLQKGIEQTYKKLWRLYYEYSYSHGRGW